MPFVAIGAFAGLRSAEIVRLEWQEIRFTQNVIEIKASKAKTASRRLVPILPVLAEWLSSVRKESGRVLVGVKDEFALATQFKRAVDAIADENGKPLVKIFHNGLRHSFITRTGNG
jgi:integrase